MIKIQEELVAHVINDSKFLTPGELKGSSNHCGTHAIRSIYNRKFGVVLNEKIIDDLVSHGSHGDGCTPFDVICALHQLSINAHIYIPNLEKIEKDAFICGLLSNYSNGQFLIDLANISIAAMMLLSLSLIRLDSHCFMKHF